MLPLTEAQTSSSPFSPRGSAGMPKVAYSRPHGFAIASRSSTQQQAHVQQRAESFRPASGPAHHLGLLALAARLPEAVLVLSRRRCRTAERTARRPTERAADQGTDRAPH